MLTDITAWSELPRGQRCIARHESEIDVKRYLEEDYWGNTWGSWDLGRTCVPIPGKKYQVKLHFNPIYATNKSKKTRDFMLTAWSQISDECFENIVISMPRRFERVLKEANTGTISTSICLVPSSCRRSWLSEVHVHLALNKVFNFATFTNSSVNQLRKLTREFI